MTVNRETREMLNALSKKVFGVSSKWQKLVNDGVSEPYEREREVMVTKANGAPEKRVFKDRKYVLKRYSVEEVLKLMTDILASNQPVAAGSTQETDPTT